MCALKSEKNMYDEKNLKAIENRLEISFKNKELLKAAITSNKTRENNPHLKLTDFQNLAFLGDSLLYFITSKYVIKKYAGADPPINLHDEREYYRENYSLERVASEHKLYELLWFDEGYRRDPPSIKWIDLMGTYIEAIIGAYYLDTRDIEAVRRFIEEHLIPNIDRLLE